jgi:hypothetical protein
VGERGGGDVLGDAEGFERALRGRLRHYADRLLADRAAATDAPAGGDVTWDMIMGMGRQFGAEEEAKAEREAARAALSPLPGPLNWMDVLGMSGAQEDTAAAAPASAPAAQPPTAAPELPPAEAAPAAGAMPWDVLGDDMAPTAAPPAPASHGEEKPLQPLSWADVLGVPPEDGEAQ